MDRCGGSREYSKLDRENEEDQERSVDTDDKLKAPKSGIRILDSLTYNGYPRRCQEDGNHESPTRAVLTSPKASATQPSLRQSMVDATIDRVTTSPASTLRYPVKTLSPSWKIQPMYDKAEAEMILRWKIQPVHDDDDALTSLSTENETEVLLGIPREEPSLDAERSQTTLQKDSSKVALYAPSKDDDEKLCVKTRSSITKSHEAAGLRPPLSGKREKSAASSDMYNDIELLVARVKRLDALSKAGEVAAVASVDGEGDPTVSNVKKGTGETPYFAPTDRLQQGSSVDHAKCQEKETAAPTVQELVDGSNDFQVIYRRQPGSPGTIWGTIAASSIASMSSFDVPATTAVHRSVLIPKYPSRETRSSAKQLTAHPFFWRTHPRGTFTSYGNILPQKKIISLAK